MKKKQEEATAVVNVGANIRLWRERKLMKQEVLAKELGITGVALSNIENNKADITITRLFQIAAVLEVKPAMLVSEDPVQYFVFGGSNNVNNGVVNNNFPDELIALVVDKLRK
jgi:transcriptional regulator with XRE-family HTH domain